MDKTVDYFMTPISPFVYMGHARFREICAKHQAKINLRVMDLGKVFPVSGGLALKDRPPQRRAYRMMELKRWRDHLGIPLTLEPKHFPVPVGARCDTDPRGARAPRHGCRARHRRRLWACRLGRGAQHQRLRACSQKSSARASSRPIHCWNMHARLKSRRATSSIRRRRSCAMCSALRPTSIRTSFSGGRIALSFSTEL